MEITIKALREIKKIPMNLVGKHEQDIQLAHVINAHVAQNTLDFVNLHPVNYREIQKDVELDRSLVKKGLVEVSEGNKGKLTLKGYRVAAEYLAKE